MWERLGLQARVTGLFAFGALLLSLLMGGLSFYTTSHFLVSDQVNAAITAGRRRARPPCRPTCLPTRQRSPRC